MNATSFNPLAVARDLKAAGAEPAHAGNLAEGMQYELVHSTPSAAARWNS